MFLCVTYFVLDSGLAYICYIKTCTLLALCLTRFTSSISSAYATEYYDQYVCYDLKTWGGLMYKYEEYLFYPKSISHPKYVQIEF